jgi:hypothetical protein
LGEQRPEVGAAQAGDVEAGTLQGRKQALFCLSPIEKS